MRWLKQSMQDINLYLCKRSQGMANYRGNKCLLRQWGRLWLYPLAPMRYPLPGKNRDSRSATGCSTRRLSFPESYKITDNSKSQKPAGSSSLLLQEKGGGMRYQIPKKNQDPESPDFITFDISGFNPSTSPEVSSGFEPLCKVLQTSA